MTGTNDEVWEAAMGGDDLLVHSQRAEWPRLDLPPQP